MMKFVRSLITTSLTIAFVAPLLTSCVNPMKTVHDTDYNVSQNQRKIQQIQGKSTLPAPPVAKYSGYYVNPRAVDNTNVPSWMLRRITLNAQNVPLSFVVTQILRDSNTAVSYQSGTNENSIVSINYSGSIKGALDQLAADTNYGYSTDNGTLTWQSMITKTFNVSFMPGTSSYQVGQNEGSGAGEAMGTGGGGGAGGGGGNTIVTLSGDLGAQQFSQLKGDLSVWDDLTATVNNLKSPDGKVSVSQSTTSVTVYDHPANVKAIGDYIDQLNNNLSREVAIQVEVLEIDLDKEFNYGIDWAALWNVLGTRIGISGALGTAANITQVVRQGEAGNPLAVFQIGPTGGSQAFINALSSQGRVSVVTQPRVVTMNNQMAEIKITRDTGYLQSVSNTTVANAGNATNTSSLTPGLVTSGFSLYLLPKIQKNKIYLQISSNLATLQGITTVTNNPAGLAGTTQNPTNTGGSSTQPNSSTETLNINNNSSPQYQAIQVPELTNQDFNQRTVISSGSTLVIAGFQQLRDLTNRNQLAGIQPLGGLGAAHSNVQTLVLITPTVLGKY